MNGAEGYIKLHRKLEESAVFENPNSLQVFIWALLRANYKARTVRFGGECITLGPGQFVSGRYAGANACRMKPSTFRNQIHYLREAQILDSKSDNKKTLFTVVNWTRYQGKGFKEDSKKDSERTARGHRQEGKKGRRKTDGVEHAAHLTEVGRDSLDLKKNGSAVAEFVRFFYAEHEARRGSVYAVSRGRDHAAAKRMIDSLGLQECKTRAVRYLSREDRWTHEHGFSIGNMEVVINGLGGKDGRTKNETVEFLNLNAVRT